MNGTDTIEVDTSRLTAAIGSLSDALGTTNKPADASDIIRDETRRLVAEIVKLTPPHTNKDGQAAVKRNVGVRLFTGVNPGLIDAVYKDRGQKKQKVGLINLDTWLTKTGGEKMHLKWDRVDPKGSGLRDFHYASLKDSKNGRFKKGRKTEGVWKALYVAPKNKVNAYVRKVQKHVGRWKASWAATAMALGASRVSPWIRRHIENNATPKSITHTEGLMNGAFPTVTFGSRAPGVGKQRRIISNAVRIRSEAITRRVKLVLSGYARDLSKQMKAQRRAASTGLGGRNVIS